MVSTVQEKFFSYHESITAYVSTKPRHFDAHTCYRHTKSVMEWVFFSYYYLKDKKKTATTTKNSKPTNIFYLAREKMVFPAILGPLPKLHRSV